MYTTRSLKMALIDDDPQMSEMLKDFLKTKYPSSEVTVYPTGDQALRTMTVTPDLIVLDYHLDSTDALAMNGLQVLRLLKERFVDTPVIFLSSEEKVEIAANTMKFGAYDYIVKNESAFHRLEILANNIISQSVLKKNLGSQRFFNRLLGIVVLILLIGIIVTLLRG